MSSRLYIKLKMMQNKLQILNLKLILMLLVQFRIIFMEQRKEKNYGEKIWGLVLRKLVVDF
jgi:hypothetical protein